MPKVVKAFSVDYKVAEYIDSFPAGTRSEHVNWALKSYFFSQAGEELDYQRALVEMWKDKALSKQGVKYHLGQILRIIFRR